MWKHCPHAVALNGNKSYASALRSNAVVVKGEWYMRGRKEILIVGAAIGTLLAVCMTGPSAGASAPIVTTQSPGHYSDDVQGCGTGFRLWVPSASAPQLLDPASAHALGTLTSVRELPRRHVRWLSSLRCRSVPDRPTGPSRQEVHLGSTPSDHFANDMSANWSGYQTNRSSIVGATSDWNVPAVREPSNKTVVSSIWPGIGTGNSKTDSLIQAGSEQDGACELGCTTHKTSYYYWIEIYPQESEQQITNLSAHPGDNVQTTVGYKASTHTATFVVCDNTQGICAQGSQPIQSGGSSGSYAEWILERTEACGVHCNYPSLNDFGTETMKTNQASIGSTAYSVRQLGPTGIDMWNCAKSQQLDRTGAIDSSDLNFPITWLNYGPSELC